MLEVPVALLRCRMLSLVLKVQIFSQCANKKKYIYSIYHHTVHYSVKLTNSLTGKENICINLLSKSVQNKLNNLTKPREITRGAVIKSEEVES